MRNTSFHTDKFKAFISPKVKRVRSLPVGHRFKYGSAIVLALLVTPVAVQAVSATLSSDDVRLNDAEPSQHIEQLTPEVKADMNEKTESSSSSEVNVQSAAGSSSGSDVDITVNGQNVPVPKNGSVHKHMSSDGNETIVDVRIDNGSSSHNSSSTSTSIEIEQHSSSSGNDNDERSEVRRIPRR